MDRSLKRDHGKAALNNSINTAENIIAWNSSVQQQHGTAVYRLKHESMEQQHTTL
jgi:hypothetical protein